MRSICLTLAMIITATSTVRAQESSTAASPEGDAPVTPEPAASSDVVPAPPSDPVVSPAPAPAAAPTPAPATPLLIEAGELTLRPRLQARVRYEGRIHPYGDGVDLADQHFVTARVRVGLDARWRAVRIVAEIQDVGSYGTFPGQDDGNRLALHQGFVEVGTENAYARLGRQEVALGDERYVGPLDWLMAARSFDALRVHLAKGIFAFDGFGAILRGQATYAYTDAGGEPQSVSSRGDYFAFAQLAIRPSDRLTFEGYTLYRHDGALATAPARDRDVVAPGIRVAGKLTDALSYMFEGQVQLGRTQTSPTNEERHLALAGTFDLRYAFEGTWHPSLGVGANYATGNHGSQRFDEVENFFPTNHKFYGNADLFGMRNLVEGHALVELRPGELPLKLNGGFRAYALENPTGRWSNASGAQLGVSQSNDSRFLGVELDAVATFTAHPRLVLSGGYSVFVPAAGAENLGHDEVQHFFYLMLGADTQ